jgi:hypothetical protein
MNRAAKCADTCSGSGAESRSTEIDHLTELLLQGSIRQYTNSSVAITEAVAVQLLERLC